jgi:TM2 domain-containing membrane protein YozV
MSQFTVTLPLHGRVSVDGATLAGYARAKQIDSSTLVLENATGVTYLAKQIPGLFSDKEFLTTLLLAIFLGSLGVDRFYLGQSGLGIGKLLVTIFSCFTAGWIWQIVDIILIATRSVTDNQGRPLS